LNSLHIPINPESKKAYDEWVQDDCRDRWWQKKEETEQIEREVIQREKEKMLCFNSECERLERKQKEIKN